MTENFVLCDGCESRQKSTSLFCENCGEALIVGKELGVYRVLRCLGKGGMGAVYEVEHQTLGTHFALKLLHKQFASNKDLVARFVNEAKATSRLRHEHIIFITDFGTFDAFGPYIAMEHLRGLPLKDHLQPEVPFPFERVIRIAVQLADTMAYAHSEQIVHRDLKPDNIFLVDRSHDDADYIKVLDFGIAKSLEDTDGVSLTRTGAVLGTPLYMSPEQGFSQPLDARSDIYSFGVILFEMLTGTLPFVGATAFDLIQQRLTQPPPKISTYASEWDRSPMETLVNLCLQREPSERIQTMLEIKKKLMMMRRRTPPSVPAFRKPSGSETTGFWQEGALPTSDQSSSDTAPLGKLPGTPQTPPPGTAVPVSPVPVQAPAPSLPEDDLPSGVMIGAHETQPPASTVPPVVSTQPPEPCPAPASFSSLDDLSAVSPNRTPFIIGGVVVLMGVAGFFLLPLFKQPASTPPTTPKRGVERRVPVRVPAPVRPVERRVAVERRTPEPIRRVVPRRRRFVRRRYVRRRIQRRRRRVVRRVLPVPRVVRRIVPVRRVVPVRRPVLVRGANGCLLGQNGTTYTRLYANFNRARVSASLFKSKLRRAKRIKHAKGGKGWCIPVGPNGTWVRLFGESFEHADCWFWLRANGRRVVRVKLKHVDEQGPGGYCRP